MVKVKVKSKKQQTKSSADINLTKFNELLQNKWTDYIFVGIIILLLLFVFSGGLFGGKTFSGGDHDAANAFNTYLDDAKKEGIYPLWLPYIFVGMPSLASLTTGLPRMYDITTYLVDTIVNFPKTSGNFFLMTFFYYIIFAVAFYLYARNKFNNKLIALYCGIAAVFITPIVQLIIVGHHTKMMTLAVFPLILLLIDKIIDLNKNKQSITPGKYKILLFFVLLTVTLHIQLMHHHIQMLFYSYLMIGLYLLYELLASLIKKENVTAVFRAIILFLFASVVSLLMDADILLSVKEYNKYSMRGLPSIESRLSPENPLTSQIKDSPLDYEYATNWSFSPGEVMTFFIPSYYGFGNVEVEGRPAYLYWGQMPFTDSPVYFGIVTAALAIVGIVFNFRKNIFVQALSVTSFLFLILSFGKNFPLLFDLFFKYFPFFSSFRAPVMILYYFDIAFVILAGFGLKTIFEAVTVHGSQFTVHRKQINVLYVLFGIGALMFIIAFIGFENSYVSAVLNGPAAQRELASGVNPQQLTPALKQLGATAYSLVVKEMRVSSILIMLTIGISLLFIKRKIPAQLFAVLIILLIFIDLFMVTSKTMHWQDKKQKEESFKNEPDYVKWILSNNPNTYTFRVVEINEGTIPYNNKYAYFRLHQFHGYQGAKMRIYQDARDVVGDRNPLLLSLGNVKYVITDKPMPDTNFKPVFKGSRMLLENTYNLPRAFFVNFYKVAKDIEILNNIKQMNFNPREIAFFENDINKNIEPADSSAYAKLLNADIHNLDYEVNASGNNLLFLSEIFYPAGWKAYIDGNETEIYKTNYLFRSVVVPKGVHKLELKFYPETFYLGKNITIFANLFLLAIIFVYIGGVILEKKKNKK
ncbi:MAG: YfhO family protein [Ignavibacteria bacterium]|nr:YfhO family protein [Ignavibacteria bacterium]